MRSTIVALLLLIFFSCKESGVDLGKPATFVRYFNGGTPDQAQAIIPTSDNGYVILANSLVTLTSTFNLIKLIKVDAYGNKVWETLIPQPPADAVANPPTLNYRGFGITAISDNSGTDTGYLVVGDKIYNDPAANGAKTQALLMIQIDPSDGSVAKTVVKPYDSISVVQQNGQPLKIQVQGQGVTRLASGNFVVLGQALNGPDDMSLSEVKAGSLDLKWTRTFGDASTKLVNKVFTVGDSIYWGGTKVETSTSMRWDKAWINSGPEYYLSYPNGGTSAASYTCNDICRFGFGYGLVGSYSKVAGKYSRMAFYRIDAYGHFADSATYTLSNPQSFPAGNSITSTNDGGFLMLGTTSTDAQETDANYFLVKTDAHGVTQWTKTYGGKFFDVGCKVLQAKDGYIVLGTTTLANVPSIFLMKTDSQGEIQ